MESMCPLCEKRLFSGLTHGCKLCGMPLTSPDEDFCSQGCEDTFDAIHKEASHVL